MARIKVQLPTVNMATATPPTTSAPTPAVKLPDAPAAKAADPDRKPWTPARLLDYVTLAGDAGYAALADRAAYTAHNGDEVEGGQVVILLRSAAHFHRVFDRDTGLERVSRRRQYTAVKVADVALLFSNGSAVVKMLNDHAPKA